MHPSGFSHQMYDHGSVLCQQTKHDPCLLTIAACILLLTVSVQYKDRAGVACRSRACHIACDLLFLRVRFWGWISRLFTPLLFSLPQNKSRLVPWSCFGAKVLMQLMSSFSELDTAWSRNVFGRPVCKCFRI